MSLFGPYHSEKPKYQPQKSVFHYKNKYEECVIGKMHQVSFHALRQTLFSSSTFSEPLSLSLTHTPVLPLVFIKCSMVVCVFLSPTAPPLPSVAGVGDNKTFAVIRRIISQSSSDLLANPEVKESQGWAFSQVGSHENHQAANK